MSYATGEAAILAVIVDDVSGFDANNTSRGNWQILNTGKADSYAILRSGTWDNEQATITNHMRTYTTVVEVWLPYRDKNTYLTLIADVELIANELIAHKTLGLSTVQRFTVAGAGEVEVITQKDNSLWLKQEINCLWQEELSVTYE